MRFGRDKLTFMGLVALDEVLELSRGRPFEPDFTLRTVLAMLFAMSDGNPDDFNGFWHACSRKPVAGRIAHMEELGRNGDMRGTLNGIRASLGWTPTILLGSDIALARRDPGPNHRAYEALHLDPGRSEREQQRKAFAEWLLATDCLGNDQRVASGDGRSVADQSGVLNGVSPGQD